MGLASYLQASLNRRSRGLRRIAALCLLLLGVHTAGDRLDDVIFAAVDRVDLAIDSALWHLSDALTSAGLLSEATAAHGASRATAWVDLAEKDALSLWLALIAELLTVLLLLDFVWGPRRPARPPKDPALWAQLRHSITLTLAQLRPLDVERLIVPPAMLILCLGGLGVTALALETAAAQLIGRAAWARSAAPAAAAWVGLLSGLLLLGRVVPAMVEGALFRAAERAEGGDVKRGMGWRGALRQRLRGWPRALLIGGVALMAALTHGPLAGLLSRAAGAF